MNKAPSRGVLALMWAAAMLHLQLRCEAGFVPTAAPSNANQANLVTLLPNGDVLVLGSTIKSNLPTAEIYTPLTRTWRTGNPSPVSVGFASLLGDGKLLVGGGLRTYSQDGNIYRESQSAAALYDWQTEEWIPIPDMNVARNSGTAVLLKDGRLLVAGGAVWDGYGIVPLGDPDVELYEPQLRKWVPLQSLAKNRSGSFGTLLSNGNVLIMGGSAYIGGYQWEGLATAEVYNPDADRWTPTQARPSGIVSFGAIKLLNNRILVAGGYTNNNENGRPVWQRDCDVYDPITDTWSPTGSLSLTRTSPPALTLLQDGKVLAFPELYDPASGAWTLIAPTNYPITGSFTPLLDGSALAITYSVKFTSSSYLYSTRADLYVADLPVVKLITELTSDSAIRLSFTNSPGAIFTVLTSTNLSAPLSDWTALGRAQEPSEGIFEYVGPVAANDRWRYYAIRVPQ